MDRFSNYIGIHRYREVVREDREKSPLFASAPGLFRCLVSKTCSTEFEQIARQLEFKHQSQIFKLLPMNYD